MKCVFALTMMLFVVASVYSQHEDWTVQCWEGKSGTLTTLTDCKLDSLAADSLRLVRDGNYRWVNLYLLHELSHPEANHSVARPVWIGALVGGAVALAVTTMLGDFDSHIAVTGNPKLAVSTLLTVVGSGIGLAVAMGSRNLSYRFGEIPNPDKRDVIEKIMEEERNHLSEKFGRVPESVNSFR